MTNSTEREELAELIARRRYAKNARPSIWITGRAALEVADAILAAGYSKPDAITTTEDLDALPTGAVVIDGAGAGNIYRKLDRSDGIGWYEPGEALNWDSLELNLPATVLHIGTTK